MKIDPNNPYKGRLRPKFTASKGGKQSLRSLMSPRGEQRYTKGAVPSGNYDVNAWWRAGRGEANPNFLHTNTSRTRQK
jgi:hypothetical protein